MSNHQQGASTTNHPSDVVPQAGYAGWRRQRLAKRLAEGPGARPVWNHLISVVLVGRPEAADDLSASLASLARQLYRNIEVLLVGPLPGTPVNGIDLGGLRGLAVEPLLSPLALLTDPAQDRLWRGSHLIFARAGTEFDADAFALLNAALTPTRGAPRPDLVLSDHDRRLGPGDYAGPSFVPGWDPDFIQTYDYVGTAFMASRALILSQRAAGPATSLHDWLRRVGCGHRQPATAHVPEALLHLPGPPPAPPTPCALPALPADPPAVAIVVPSRNHPEMLARCLDFLDSASCFRPEVVVVDNGSDDPLSAELYAHLRERHGVRVLRMDQPFNFSRMINLGVAATSSALLLLLNNDVHFAAPDQIEQLLAAAMRPEVGVAGCRLLYPDGRTQHAGVLLRPGSQPSAPVRAIHVLRGAAPEAAGYLYQLKTIRNWQAVTGAVMAMRREVFDLAGGFDEVSLPVEYNDIDFCLRVRRAGLRVVALPLEGVFHRESATRGSLSTPAIEAMRLEAKTLMASRWPDAVGFDPFWNPWLASEETPEVRFPWSVTSPAAPTPTAESREFETGGRPRALRGRAYRALRRGARLALRSALRHRRVGERAHALLGRIIAEDNPHARPGSDPIPGGPYDMPETPRTLREGLCVSGYFRSEIGLGQAARNIAYACDSQRLPVSFRDLPLSGRANDEEFASKCNADADRKAGLLIAGLAHLSALSMQAMPGRANFLYPFWELSRIPGPWLDVVRCFDEVWAPSRFVAEALGADLGRPVRLVPQAVRLPESDPPPRQRRQTLRLLTYLDFDSWGTRKNPKGAVAAFQAAFPPARRDVEFVVKTRGSSDGGLRDWLRRTATADRRIRVMDATLNRAEMDSLIAGCDAFFSPHRSEGFGFGAAEAMAAARAVVATDYGGTRDFVTIETGYPLAFALEPLRAGDYVDTEGQVWANPIQEAAVEALRSIYDDPTEADARARRGLTLLRRRHAPAVAGAQIAGLLKQRELL